MMRDQLIEARLAIVCMCVGTLFDPVVRQLQDNNSTTIELTLAPQMATHRANEMHSHLHMHMTENKWKDC